MLDVSAGRNVLFYHFGIMLENAKEVMPEFPASFSFKTLSPNNN
jgi:hypothetical protein